MENSCEILFGKTKKNKTSLFFFYLMTFFLIILENWCSLGICTTCLPIFLPVPMENLSSLHPRWTIIPMLWMTVPFALIKNFFFLLCFFHRKISNCCIFFIPSPPFFPQPTPFQLSSPLLFWNHSHLGLQSPSCCQNQCSILIFYFSYSAFDRVS